MIHHLQLKSFLFSVVSTERLVLWRSEIFGGISNEISVLLDDSTLPKELESMPFWSKTRLFFFH